MHEHGMNLDTLLMDQTFSVYIGAPNKWDVSEEDIHFNTNYSDTCRRRY